MYKQGVPSPALFCQAPACALPDVLILDQYPMPQTPPQVPACDCMVHAPA